MHGSITGIFKYWILVQFETLKMRGGCSQNSGRSCAYGMSDVPSAQTSAPCLLQCPGCSDQWCQWLALAWALTHRSVTAHSAPHAQAAHTREDDPLPSLWEKGWSSSDHRHLDQLCSQGGVMYLFFLLTPQGQTNLKLLAALWWTTRNKRPVNDDCLGKYCCNRAY